MTSNPYKSYQERWSEGHSNHLEARGEADSNEGTWTQDQGDFSRVHTPYPDSSRAFTGQFSYPNTYGSRASVSSVNQPSVVTHHGNGGKAPRPPVRWGWASLVGGLMLLGVLAVTGVLSIVLIEVLIANVSPGEEELTAEQAHQAILPFLLLLSPIMLLGGMLLTMRLFRIHFRDIGFHTPTVKFFHVFWQFPAIILLMSLVQRVVTIFAPEGAETTNTAALNAVDGLNPFVVIAGFIGIAVITPFAEEIYFRGILMNCLKLRWGLAASVLVSGFLFALVHGMIWVIPGLFVVGVGFALMRVFHGNIWASIAAHAMQNGMVYLAFVFYPI